MANPPRSSVPEAARAATERLIRLHDIELTAEHPLYGAVDPALRQAITDAINEALFWVDETGVTPNTTMTVGQIQRMIWAEAAPRLVRDFESLVAAASVELRRRLAVRPVGHPRCTSRSRTHPVTDAP